MNAIAHPSSHRDPHGRSVRHATDHRASARALLQLAPVLIACWAIPMPSAHAQPSMDSQPIGYVAPMDFSTYNLAGGSAVAFRGDYIRASWDGDLVAHSISSQGAVSVKWRAREKVPAHGSRIIFTSTASGTGAAFRWTGSSTISATQKTALGGDTNGPKVLNYLRGDKTDERTDSAPTKPYRQRYSTLGAVIHSRPYFDGETVYVGANDGMLHAFDAATGTERWAYVPGQLYASGRLASVATPSDGVLPYTVDGSMAVGTAGSVKLLVGALGTGAKGLYALNIASPKPSNEATAASMALWEISADSTDYGNMGHVVSAPQIVKLNTGETAVLVPNGLGSRDGTSTLFVIRASDGARLAEISAGSGSGNALGGIAAVDRDGNGTVDVVYAGDLKGTMWRFDFSATTGLPTSATALHTPSNSELQPITAAPSVVAHPRGGLMVIWGTGRLHTDTDLSSTADNYLYGRWDSTLATATSLVTQTLTTRTVNGTKVRTSSANAVNYASGARGWRITLSGGERLIGGDTLADSGRFVVTTAVPAGTNQGAWLMQIDAYTGGAPTAPFVDLDGDGTISGSDNSDRVEVVSGTSSSWQNPVGTFIGTGVWSQPVLAQVSSTLDRPFLNYNANVPLPTVVTTITTVTTPPSNESGVYGGHFDFDIFYNCDTGKPVSKGDCNGKKHVHEYDDKFNVVGVNMTQASESAFNLSNAITNTTTTSFKILVSNTRWSPAATLKVGSTAGQAWKLPVSPEGFLAATAGGTALTFTRSTLGSNFVYALPLTAFTNKDWGTGEVRSGLVPTQTGCIQDNKGPTLAWMDGAFTVQVVDASAGASHVMAVTVSSGSQPGGYRLKDDAASRGKLLAQYSTFWHHDNKQCMLNSSGTGFNSSWTMAPAADTSNSNSGSKPSGSLDPEGTFASGYFEGDVSGGTTTTTIKVTFNGVEVIVTRTFDVTGLRQVLKAKSNGSVLSDVLSGFGSAQRADLQLGQRPRTGRLGWKEIVR